MSGFIIMKFSMELKLYLAGNGLFWDYQCYLSVSKQPPLITRAIRRINGF